jgi:hypothetical protein
VNKACKRAQLEAFHSQQGAGVQNAKAFSRSPTPSTYDFYLTASSPLVAFNILLGVSFPVVAVVVVSRNRRARRKKNLKKKKKEKYKYINI